MTHTLTNSLRNHPGMTDNHPPLTCRAVLFDLDGTLVDSAPDLCSALNHVLAGRGVATIDQAKVKHLVGNGARALLARGFWGEEAEPPAVEDDFFKAAVADFLAFYGDHLTDHSQPYPGVPETLESLRREGFQLAVVTNKPEYLTHRLLAGLGLDHLFEAVVGGDTLPQRKPDPAPLLHALAGLGTPPHRAVMVGDSDNDIFAARAARCPVVAVSYGYARGRPVAELNPDRVVDRFEQLAPLLALHVNP